jgi:serine/threonine-protein kinase
MGVRLSTIVDRLAPAAGDSLAGVGWHCRADMMAPSQTKGGQAMDAGQWSRVREVFEAALERPPGERIAFVAAACADDDLRREVHAMLAADAGTMAGATELASAAPDLVAGLADDADSGESGQFVGSRVGPWKLERELGRGGMGAVYLGQRVDGDFRQCAAVKLVRSSWEAGELQRRFRSERRILAGLDHPNIARLVDGGETADGKPYLAMEYVDGQPLCAHCDAQRLPVAERLRLFLAVCAAVAHAHRSLVVHRDLKPSNVLVSGDGEVKLLDFGIARLLENDAPATGSAMRLFTPEYAAPEQVRGDPLTTSVDVYALGVMLFELLTGRRPYRLAAATPMAIERAILGEEAQRPSQAAVSGDALSSPLAHARASEPHQLGASLRGDLDAIVLKALRKEPQQRYASVEALANDVRRYLQRQPVTARRGNWRYRGVRFLQRHWLAVALGSIAFAGILAGLAVALWQAERARHQEFIAQDEARKARGVSEFLTGVFKAAEPGSSDGRDPRASELLRNAADKVGAQADLGESTRANLLMAIGSAYLSLDDHPRGLVLMRSAREAALRGDDARLRVETQLELARALDSDGQSSAALQELEQAQPFVIGDPLGDNVLRRRFGYLIAIVYNNLDRSLEALPHLDRAYREAVATDGLGSAAVGKFVDLYSSLLVSAHRNDEAIVLTRANYEASRQRPGLPLLERSNFAAAYGLSLLRSGRAAEAERAYREALALDEQLYGVGNLATDVSMNNVTAALRNQGKFAEAAQFGERVLALRKAHLPADAAATARSLAMLGEIWRSAGDYGKAVPLLREGVAIFDRRGEDDRASAITAHLNLIRALEAAGGYDEALQVMAHVLPHTQRSSSQYAGAGGAEVRLMDARLLARAAPDGKDCSAIARVLEVAPAGEPAAVEAHVLGADCERRNGRVPAMRAPLVAIDAAGLPPDRLSAYARARLDDLRGVAR